MARPRTFDPDSVLDRAAEIFVEQGFAAVGIETLTDELGLSRSSIYGAFGSKQGLWLQALGRYRHHALEGLREVLSAEGDVLPAVTALLDAIRVSVEEGVDARCLVVLAACERGATDPDTAAEVSQQFAAIDTLLHDALVRAVSRGELAPDVDAGGLASLISAVISGVRVKAAAEGANPVAIRALHHMTGLLDAARSAPATV
ncbi:TetR/AcrR family transcriptional regulator [Euzebya tangerina]|uniref:TetR/AcrR family transcriptional regulator n=1 Tax=Euzebya tangerina TaxID=591198 RepID=UPI000E313233|nr:TetR/AcrR family transcriptional regulator [Euzebya tangerina]